MEMVYKIIRRDVETDEIIETIDLGNGISDLDFAEDLMAELKKEYSGNFSIKKYKKETRKEKEWRESREHLRLVYRCN